MGLPLLLSCSFFTGHSHPGMLFPLIPAWLPSSQLDYPLREDHPHHPSPGRYRKTCLTFYPISLLQSVYPGPQWPYFLGYPIA